jgi:hypothetical protein
MQKIDVHCHTTNRILKDSANQTLRRCHRLYEGLQHHQTILLATYFPQRGTGIQFSAAPLD